MKHFVPNADHRGGRLIFRAAGLAQLRKRGVKSPRYRIEGIAFSDLPPVNAKNEEPTSGLEPLTPAHYE
jgi:hypothetical protein